MNILIIEDEKQLAEALEEILKRQNYNAVAITDGEAGLDYALVGDYDLIILDIMLPKINGFEVLKQIRANNQSVPVLMLSAKAGTYDKISGLDLGADDYLTKPFSVDELLARVRALLRRKGELLDSCLTFSNLTLNRNSFELVVGTQKVRLGYKEFQISEMLIINANNVVAKERLLEKVWGIDYSGEYNNVEVYVSFLRKKLLAIGAKCEIKSLRNLGYVLEETS